MTVIQPTSHTSPHAPVSVTTRGGVSRAMEVYARDKVAKVYRYSRDTVRSAHVVLSYSHDPARPRPALAEAGLELDSTRVRAQAAEPTMREAIDVLVDRLQSALVQHRDTVVTRHRWLATQRAHEWRHGSAPAPMLDHFRRPVEDREVVRRKTFALEPMSVEEAAFDMDLLGHEFYLFVDRASGTDAVVSATRGGYAVRGALTPPEGTSVPVRYDGPAPTLTDAEAKERLDLAGEPFLFYLDRASGRGRVLYLRYDGHYGLVEAAED
jgi:ribosomal subunit interface protein